jgi:membrane-bound lytic murein transglycosylase D
MNIKNIAGYAIILSLFVGSVSDFAFAQTEQGQQSGAEQKSNIKDSVDVSNQVGDNQASQVNTNANVAAVGEPVITQNSNQAVPEETVFVFGQNQKTDLPKIQRRKKSDIVDPLSILPQGQDGNLANTTAEAAAIAQQDTKTRAQIKKIRDTYAQLVEAFDNNDQKATQKLYKSFMKQLASADIQPALMFFLFDDYDEIMAKLGNLYGLETATTLRTATPDNSIPLTLEDQALVERYIKIFTTGKSKQNIEQALARAQIYKDIVEPTLAEFNLPPELKYLPVIESLYKPRALSRAGALGLWQIMPSRARALGLRVNYWVDERLDPEKATEAAALYLKQLYLMLGDWHLALAAYNRGEYGLIRDMRFSNASSITEMVQRRAIPKETQNYIPQFIAVSIIAKDPKKYGLNVDANVEPLKYDVVKTDKVMDLKIAAEAAGITVERLRELNPSIKEWCTPHGYSGFELKIPYGSRELFLANIAKVKELNPSPGIVKYKIVKGDNISKIAEAFKTTQKNIIADNPSIAKSKYLQVGAVLTIKPGKGYVFK